MARSGEVDVVAETGFSCTLEQAKQCRAFVATGSTPDDNDDAMMRIRSGEMEKVVPIAGQEYATPIVSEAQYNLVGGIVRKRLAQQHDLVTELLK